MSETRAVYTAKVTPTIGAIPHVSANISGFIAPSEILDLYLEFTGVGIKPRLGVDPSTIPHEVFDTAWQRVNVNLDKARWWIADLSILHESRFDKGDCVRAMAAVGLYRTLSTAETWANWARNVPYEVRIPAQLEDGTNTKMSIYWHKHVAMLPVEVQDELLQLCLVNNLSGNVRWTEDKFGEVCQAWRDCHNFKPPQQRLVNRPARDVIFEATMELGAAEVARDKAVEMSQNLAQTVTATDAALWHYQLRVLGALLG
jgi:hypothetical protein